MIAIYGRAYVKGIEEFYGRGRPEYKRPSARSDRHA